MSPAVSDTRSSLLKAGLDLLGENGYAASRLADIASRAGLTTGAFYRHFPSKLDFFRDLFDDYAAELTVGLKSPVSIAEAMRNWLAIARKHTGVVRALAETMRPGTREATMAHELRTSCAYLLEPQIRAAGVGGRAEALMICDILDQYALMEACGWIPRRDPTVVANALAALVTRGLYLN